ncbi:MAG TPA: hypothetical protein VFF81_11445, partial [Noviherbaspirillum sp.]|nr:hypothetical protein [Noviherbaspirillum sp.]
VYHLGNRRFIYNWDPSLLLLIECFPIPLTIDGTPWHFSAHQFRRFYAICYYWRYMYGDLAALSYHLRHFNPNMTLTYVTEAVAGDILGNLSDERRRFVVHVLTSAARGDITLTGLGGERVNRALQRQMEKLSAQVDIITPEIASTVAETAARSVSIEPAKRENFCTCTTTATDLAQAKCLEVTGVPLDQRSSPDYSAATRSVCAGCPNELMIKHLHHLLLQQEIDANRRMALISALSSTRRAEYLAEAERLEALFVRVNEIQPLAFGSNR